jgi:hypothetical protein
MRIEKIDDGGERTPESIDIPLERSNCERLSTTRRGNDLLPGRPNTGSFKKIPL